MQCKQCGNELVRGFSFCLECGLPVPDEMLEESGLPQRNIDTGPKTRGVGESAERIDEDPAARQTDVIPEEPEPGDLKPRFIGGSEEDRGTALKPQLVGGDSGIGGKDLKPRLMGLGEEIAGNALKPQYIGGGDDDKGTGEQVKVVLQETSSETDNVTEKLVFCPNCGMRMQHNPHICDVCGMLLGNKPTNVPKSPSGVPLFNTDGDAFAGGFGAGSGGFGGGLEGLSDDALSIDSFMGGNNDPMFNQTSPADNLAALSEQLAGFSAAAGMRSIGETENTRVRQTEPDKGMEREVSDFTMIDDLSSESVPMSDDGMPVVGDYSMEDDPDQFVDLDPYRFVGMSMDEAPAEPFVKKSPSLGASSAAFEPRKAPEPVLEISAPKAESRGPEPISAPIAAVEKAPEKPIPEAPRAAEEAPMISEPAPEAQALEVPEPAVQEQNAPEPTVQTEKPPEQPAAKPETAPARTGSTKKCHACGHVMPAADKFCPNCGRSTFGAPNPNLINRASANTPAPKKRSVLPFILILIFAVVAAVFATMYFMKQNTEAPAQVESEQQTVDIEDAPSEAST